MNGTPALYESKEQTREAVGRKRDNEQEEYKKEVKKRNSRETQERLMDLLTGLEERM